MCDVNGLLGKGVSACRPSKRIKRTSELCAPSETLMTSDLSGLAGAMLDDDVGRSRSYTSKVMLEK